jgi:hypothetical protein
LPMRPSISIALETSEGPRRFTIGPLRFGELFSTGRSLSLSRSITVTPFQRFPLFSWLSSVQIRIGLPHNWGEFAGNANWVTFAVSARRWPQPRLTKGYVSAAHAGRSSSHRRACDTRPGQYGGSHERRRARARPTEYRRKYTVPRKEVNVESHLPPLPSCSIMNSCLASIRLQCSGRRYCCARSQGGPMRHRLHLAHSGIFF